MNHTKSQIAPLSAALLVLLASSTGAGSGKPPAVKPLPQAQQKAVQKYLKSLRLQTRLTPFQSGPGDVIPPCYMAFGYGTDGQGRAHSLDYHGNPLPIGDAPRTVQVWRFSNPAQHR